MAIKSEIRYLEVIILIKTLKLSDIIQSLKENFQNNEKLILFIDLISLIF